MIRKTNNKVTLEQRISYLEKKLHVKNESARDLKEAIYLGLEEGLILESGLIDECLALMDESQLMALCNNLDIPTDLY